MEHEVAGSNPVGPTLTIQVIEWNPNLFFYYMLNLTWEKGPVGGSIILEDTLMVLSFLYPLDPSLFAHLHKY